MGVPRHFLRPANAPMGLIPLKKFNGKIFREARRSLGTFRQVGFFCAPGGANFSDPLSVDDQVNILRQIFRDLGYNVALQEGDKSPSMRRTEDKYIDSNGGREIEDG